MNEYVSFILGLVRRDGALAALAVCVVLAAAVVILRRKHRPFPWPRVLVLALLAGYLVALLGMTLLGRSEYSAAYINLHWFRAWWEAWNSFSIKNWLLVVLNVAAFVPLGLLLPLAARPFRRWYIAVPTGFLASLAVETLQYLTRRGTWDVDDLLTNTLGCALGYCLVMTALCLRHRETRSPRRWLPYLATPLAFVLVLGGTFAVYALQPYGNLTLAPAYRVDLSGIQWELDLVLDNTSTTAMVYRASRMDQPSCDAFGAAFAEQAGVTFPDAYYYDDTTIFANHSTGDFLTVDYRDGSFTYRIGTPLSAEATEAGLREVLAGLGIAIPDGVTFDRTDNRCTFTADFLPVGDAVYHGVLSCRMENGAVTEVENRLVPLTPCREAAILTQSEAYTRLMQGRFSRAEPLAALQPMTVAVTACTLVYEADTKGYYQPVHQFTLAAEGLEMDQALIPALR